MRAVIADSKAQRKAHDDDDERQDLALMARRRRASALRPHADTCPMLIAANALGPAFSVHAHRRHGRSQPGRNPAHVCNCDGERMPGKDYPEPLSEEEERSYSTRRQAWAAKQTAIKASPNQPEPS